MIDRGAKALFEADQASFPERLRRKPFDATDEVSGVAERYRLLARAVIAAIRIPTTAMVEAAEEHHDRCDGWTTMETAWQDMIDEALK